MSGLIGALLLGATSVVALAHTADAAANQALSVLSSSSYTDSAGNAHVVGEIRNPSTTATLGAAAITVTARGADGGALATHAATAELDELLPGELSGFSAVFRPPAGYASAAVTAASAPAATVTPDRRLTTTVAPTGIGQVSGTVTNVDTATAHDVSVALTFYDATGRTVDVASVLVGTSGPNDIAAGASAPFTVSRPAAAPAATTVSVIAQAASQPSTPNTGSCPTLAGMSTGTVTGGTGHFHPVTPSRLLDTRLGSGKPQAGHLLCGKSAVEFQVTGVGGVPATGVSAVFLTVTGVTSGLAATAITAYPAGSPVPLASNLNLGSAMTRAHLVEVPVGVGGRVSLYSSADRVNLLADVSGYVDNASNASAGGGVVTIAPVRLADTRPGSGRPGAGATLGPRGSLRVQVTGTGGVPTSGVSAAIVNVTAVIPTANTFLTVTGAAGPVATSNVNAPPRTTVANRVISPIDATGGIHVYNNAGRTNVVVDITGYVSATSSGSEISSVVPARLADTRANSGFQGAGAAIGAGQTLTVQVTGNGGVPAGATAALVTVTVTGTTSVGFVTAYAAGSGLPAISDVNWNGPRATVPNLVITRLSSGGALTIYNRNGSADIVVDVVGYLSTA